MYNKVHQPIISFSLISAQMNDQSPAYYKNLTPIPQKKNCSLAPPPPPLPLYLLSVSRYLL